MVIRHLADTDVTSLLSASGNGSIGLTLSPLQRMFGTLLPAARIGWPLAQRFEDRTEDSTTTSWFSANGLDWVGVGELDLDAVDIGGEMRARNM